jgi:predicted DsbA family dithiol-disulfide isomerase
MKEHLMNAATGLLVACAVVVTVLVVRRELFSPAPGPERYAAVTHWREFTMAGHRSGPEDARVTIVTFSDFQCKACRMMEENLRLLQARHPDRVSVVYRHLPLASHPFAVGAVRAGECAAAQQRFQAYRDALYARQDSIGVTSWAAFAQAAGVPDLERFDRCTAETGPVPALDRDTAAARRLAASVTPTVLINHLRVDGALPLPELERYVSEAERAGRASGRGALGRRPTLFLARQ